MAEPQRNYERVNWDTTKYVNPSNMNHMDEGIYLAQQDINSNKTTIASILGRLGMTDVSTPIQTEEYINTLHTKGLTGVHSYSSHIQFNANENISCTVFDISDPEPTYRTQIAITFGGRIFVRGMWEGVWWENDKYWNGWKELNDGNINTGYWTGEGNSVRVPMSVFPDGLIHIFNNNTAHCCILSKKGADVRIISSTISGAFVINDGYLTFEAGTWYSTIWYKILTKY